MSLMTDKISSIFLNLDTIYIMQISSNLFDTWDDLWQTWFKRQMEARHKYQYKSNVHNIQLCTTSNTFVNNLKIGCKYIICKISWPSKVIKFKEGKEYIHPTKNNCNWEVEKIQTQCYKPVMVGSYNICFPITFLLLFQLTEMLIWITNFFEFE